MIKVCGPWAFGATSQEEGGIGNLGLEKPESIVEKGSERCKSKKNRESVERICLLETAGMLYS